MTYPDPSLAESTFNEEQGMLGSCFECEGLTTVSPLGNLSEFIDKP